MTGIPNYGEVDHVLRIPPFESPSWDAGAQNMIRNSSDLHNCAVNQCYPNCCLDV